MFSFLKEKLKSAVGIFTKKVEEEVDEKGDEEIEKVKEKSSKKNTDVKKEKREKKENSKEKKEETHIKEKIQDSKKIQEKSKVSKEKIQDILSKKGKEEILKKAEEEKEKKTSKEERIEEIEEEEIKIVSENEEENSHIEEKEEDFNTEYEEPSKIIEPIFSQEKEEEKKGFFGKIKGFFGKKEEKETPAEVLEEEKNEKKIQGKTSTENEAKENSKKEITLKNAIEEKNKTPIKEEKKGFFGSLGDVFTKKTLSPEKFEELFYELEIALLENNVALLVIEKIKEDMKQKLVNQKLKRNALDEEITASLEESIKEILSQESFDFLEKIKEKKDKPLVVCFFGINGSGKTTTIAKLAHYLKKNHISVVLAAADTFRAAAIDQLQKHGDNLGIKVIKQEYGADAAAVAFDAISYGRAHKIDIVLIDTAGRSHSNVNLMDELKKIIRVAKPDLNIFIGDSLTGNDMVEQAEKYKETVGIDGIILAKADADEKGGATISASYVTKKPILFLGMGQTYDDLETFNKEKILHQLGLS